MSIGNVADAMLAAMGMGVFVGEGSDRRVYRINDVVYKIPKSRNAHYYQRREYDNVRSFPTDDHSVSVPAISLYEVAGEPIIAMQYIDGNAIDEDTLSENEYYHFADLGFTDTCRGNFLRDMSGRLWIVDFGE